MSDVHVKVLLFAAVREAVGAAELDLTLGDGATAATVLDVLCARTPALVPYVPSLRVAVNGDYVALGAVVGDGDEVAVIPPVAGG